MTDNLNELERLLEERAVAYCYTWAPSRALLRTLIATAREVEGLRAEVARLRGLLAQLACDTDACAVSRQYARAALKGKVG